jgi:hypothetical protein
MRAEARQDKSEQLVKAEYRQLMAASIKKIEESYSASRMMPELERHKEELEKKRQGFRPMNGEELDEHANYFEEMRMSAEQGKGVTNF